MKKTLRKSLSLVLAVVMLVSCMVFSLPGANAASFPQTLYNGETAVIYNINAAQNGKYLVEVDVIKYASGAIESEAGDIIIRYKPGNGLEAEKSVTLEDVVATNTFNYEGNGQQAYYAVVDGFPTRATASVLKTNTDVNDSGICVGIKIWDINSGFFTPIYNTLESDRQNGAQTSGLMFSNVDVLNQYYPYAKEGSASGGALTLPENITNPKTSQINFYVKDQWGVTMISPKIDAPTVAGLSFSQDKSIVTITGTGDANYYSSSANYRDITVKATYSTANESATGITEVPQVCRITSSAVKTYAPTYDNRTKAGLSLWFTAGGTDNPEKIVLEPTTTNTYKMKTENYLKIKNNSTRTAVITSIEVPDNAPYRFVFAEDTVLAAGATLSVKIQDLEAASENYSIDADVNYTLEGLYKASSSSTLVTLTCGTTVPCIYNNSNTNTTVRCEQEGGVTSNVVVDVSLNGGSKVIYNQKSFGKKSGTSDEFAWTADCYVDTTSSPNYNSDGVKMGFHFINQYGERDNQYYFQKEDNNSGTHKQAGSYDSIGSFGFTSSPTGHTDGKKEVTGVDIGKGKGKSNDQPFYGVIFGGSTSSSAPAQLVFSKLQLFTNTGVFNNSVYFDLTLNVYAINKTLLKSSVATARSISPLSCYYTSSTYTTFNSMENNSTFKEALIQLGTDMTNQFAVTTAQTELDTAYSNMLNKGTSGASYCIVHQKHEDGDFNSPITETSVNYFVLEIGTQSVLALKDEYVGDGEGQCNKHSQLLTVNLTSSGTHTLVYNYWKIDFSRLNELKKTYNTIKTKFKFSNLDSADDELDAVNAVNQSSTNPLPETQNEVDSLAVDFYNAIRSLVFLSYEMTVTHRMVGPTGTLITSPEVPTYTEHPNKTATYGEYEDGVANINDSTYTIYGVHYYPVFDAKYLEYVSDTPKVSGITTSYTVKGSKTITITYKAKAIEDTRLSEAIDMVKNHSYQMRQEYTVTSFNEFYSWFQANRNALNPASFSIFDTEDYEQKLALYKSEEAKLDKLMTDEQETALNDFIFDYDVLNLMPSSYCNGYSLISSYEQNYQTAKELISLRSEREAGERAAQAIIDSAKQFNPMAHISGKKTLTKAPLDGVPGDYGVACGRDGCNATITTEKTLPNPNFNTAVRSYYNYSNRGAALCYSDEEAASSNTQHIRFPASCVVPKDAVVEDFGFVFIPTMNINYGVEPADNTPVNVDSLYIGSPMVSKRSVYTDENPHYTLHPQADGSSVYTFNLKLGLNRDRWDVHYAVRSYVKYSYDGISVTVYDKTYSSRSASYIAKCVMENPNELETAKQVIGAKFGYLY